MASMKAWAYTSTDGGVDKQINLIDRPLPSWVTKPPKGKVAVEVLCAGLNPVDYKLPESPIESRVARIPKPATPGLDFCGRLVAQPDRVVCGRLAWPVSHGTLGRYVLVSDNDFADKPKKCSNEEAAAIPIAALTAYQSIVPFVKARDRVVVMGGSGGVGTFSIQIAKLLGCYVVATCSDRNVSLCRELGADEVVDYTKGDIVEALRALGPFDFAVDNVGNDPTLHRRSQVFLKPRAHFVLVSAMLTSARGIFAMLESMARPRWLGGPANPYKLVLCQSSMEQLARIVTWVDDGKIRIVLDEVFEFDEAPRAMAKLRTGRARGKIVVRMSA